MKFTFLVALPILLGGCATTLPMNPIIADPVDPTASIKPSHYHNPLAGYTHRDPVGPAPWRKLNDDAAPEPTS